MMPNGPSRTAQAAGNLLSVSRRRTLYALSPLLVAAVALACPHRRHDPELQVRWDARSWHFGPYEKRDTIQVTAVLSFVHQDLAQNVTTVTKGYRLGQLNIFKVWSENGPDTVGTNALRIGDRLFDIAATRELWKVLATEREAVLVRDMASGGKGWVPRTNLDRALFVREQR